jgi:hypothetical protein
MKKYISIISVGLAISIAIAYAGTYNYKFDTGSCDNGNAWWSVSTYLDGILTEVDGVGCDGRHYSRYPHRRVVTADPLEGAEPTFTDAASNGNTWYALVRYDADHRVIWEGGKDGNGEYWVTDISCDEETQGTATTGGAMR